MATRKLYWNAAAEGKWSEAARWREGSSEGAENTLKTVPTAEDDVILVHQVLAIIFVVKALSNG